MELFVLHFLYPVGSLFGHLPARARGNQLWLNSTRLGYKQLRPGPKCQRCFLEWQTFQSAAATLGTALVSLYYSSHPKHLSTPFAPSSPLFSQLTLGTHPFRLSSNLFLAFLMKTPPTPLKAVSLGPAQCSELTELQSHPGRPGGRGGRGARADSLCGTARDWLKLGQPPPAVSHVTPAVSASAWVSMGGVRFNVGAQLSGRG